MTAPLRTCCACGTKTAKYALQRFVWKNEKVVPDPRQVELGRGAYCCKDEQCLRRFYGGEKKWKRVFRL